MNTLAAINSEPSALKKHRISAKLRHAIAALLDGRARTQKDAAALAGISRERLCRALKESHVQVFLAQETRRVLANGQARAAAVLLDLLDTKESVHARKDAALAVLRIAGIEPAAAGVTVNASVSVGYVIDLSEPEPHRRLVTIEHAPAGIDVGRSNGQDPSS